jgi:hypothetical protein
MKTKLLIAAVSTALLLAGTASAQGYGFDRQAGGLFGHIERVSQSIRAHAQRGEIPPEAADSELGELRSIGDEAHAILHDAGYMEQAQWRKLNHRVNIVAHRANLNEQEVGGWYE